MQTQNAMPTTPYLLDEYWVEAITEALEATPATVPFAIEPVALAAYDVMHGISMRPEQFYRTVADVEQYICSYKDAAQAWAERVDEINATQRGRLLTDDECAEEWADLVEGMLDEDWIRRGC